MDNPFNRTLRLKWADGEHDFRLGMKEIFELEALCGVGLGGIARRLASGEWSYRHVRDTVRLGLIGAKMPALRALQMTDMYIDEGSISEALQVAVRILDVTLDPPEAIKKKTEAAKVTPGRRTSRSTPQPSTAAAQ